MSNELTIRGGKLVDTILNEAQRIILSQRTPSEEVRWRKGRGVRQFAYTDPAFVIRTLNEAFDWDWDFLVDGEELIAINDRPFEVKVRGTLTVRAGGRTIVKTQYGAQAIEYLQDDPDTPVSVADAYKGAASDALKKCASMIGVALDIYDSDNKIHERGKTASRPQAPVARPATTQPTTQDQPAQQKAGDPLACPTCGKDRRYCGHAQQPQPVTPSPKAQPAGGNGKARTVDAITRFWTRVRELGLAQERGRELLAQAGGDPVQALAMLLNQPAAEEPDNVHENLRPLP